MVVIVKGYCQSVTNDWSSKFLCHLSKYYANFVANQQSLPNLSINRMTHWMPPCQHNGYSYSPITQAVTGLYKSNTVASYEMFIYKIEDPTSLTLHRPLIVEMIKASYHYDDHPTIG